MKTIQIEHPGVILQEEFLIPYNISSYKLSQATGIPESGISKIKKGNRAFTADTSARIGKAFGMSLDYFLKLQIDYDIRMLTANPTKELKNVEVLELV